MKVVLLAVLVSLFTAQDDSVPDTAKNGPSKALVVALSSRIEVPGYYRIRPRYSEPYPDATHKGRLKATEVEPISYQMDPVHVQQLIQNGVKLSSEEFDPSAEITLVVRMNKDGVTTIEPSGPEHVELGKLTRHKDKIPTIHAVTVATQDPVKAMVSGGYSAVPADGSLVVTFAEFSIVEGEISLADALSMVLFIHGNVENAILCARRLEDETVEFFAAKSRKKEERK